MGWFYRSLSVLSGIFVWSLVFLRTTDSRSITWYKPPPSEIVTDPTVVSKTNKNLTKGSLNEELSCEFSLTADLSIITVTMAFGVNTLATYASSTVLVDPLFVGRGNATWIPTKLTLILFNVTTADAGIYNCKVLTAAGTWRREIQVTILDQSTITFISENQTVNDGDLLWLNCSAMGNPKPIHTWTRLSDNRAVEMPFTITGKHNEGGYICTADNKVGMAATSVVFVTVESYRPFNTCLSSNLTNATAELNETIYLMCSAEANPAAKYRLYKGNESIANITATSQNIGVYATSVSDRVKEVVYKCIPFNSFGDGPAKKLIVTLHCNPDTVSLIANVTENTNCSDLLWVNFTCEASEANPPVQSYQLLKNGEHLDTASNGIWTRQILEAGKHVFSCMALHFLGNVNSFNSLTVTFSVPAKLSVNVTSGSLVLTEGGNLSLCCSAYAYPKASVTWLKLKANVTTELSNCLDFTNVGRNASGNYICIANNTCGKRNSSRQFIDVQFAPEIIALSTNLSVTQRICAGMVVNFTCTVGATNPAVDTFTLYENGHEVSSKGDTGEWIRALSSLGEVSYNCDVKNSVGTSGKVYVNFTVEVPASVKIANETIIVVLEGGNVTLHCRFNGFPQPNVSWINSSLNYIVDTDSILKLPNISRYSDGVYTCSASNACGSDSKNVEIDVQCESGSTLNCIHFQFQIVSIKGSWFQHV